MKRFIATLISILFIFFAALYFISLPHEREPQAFRLCALSIYLGFSFSMALYHMFLYFFTSKERAYLLFTAATLLMAVRVAAAPGSVMELVTPDHALPLLHYIANLSLLLPYIFAHWFTHDILRIKWGGLPTRLIYIVCIGLPLMAVAVTGQIAVWFLPMCSITNIIIVCKGFANKHCRKDPYIVMYLCAVAFYCITPFLPVILPSSRNWFAPVASLWLPWMLIQVVLLSRSYGEAKYRERELFEEKVLLENLNRTKSEFFGNISHEMKTPLTIIATDIQLAEQFVDEGKVEEAKVFMREAWQETMQTANLVTDALTFTRGQEVSRTMEPFNCGAIIETTLAVFEPLIKRQGNTLVSDVEKRLLINGNADMLASALVNLLSNANRHTNGGVIKVQWTTDDGRYRLTVSDNGSGISPEILPRVFERGVTDGSGTGLGLAIVKSITEFHGGEVMVESEAGKGTAVTLIFPALRVSALIMEEHI